MNGDALLSILINWFPMILIFGVWLVFLRQMRRPGYLPAYLQPQMEEMKKQTALLERIARDLETRR